VRGKTSQQTCIKQTTHKSKFTTKKHEHRTPLPKTRNKYNILELIPVALRWTFPIYGPPKNLVKRADLLQLSLHSIFC
jgi:hypothetical protein